MLKIDIQSEEMTAKTITPKNGADPYTIYEQYGRLAINDEIRKIVLSSRKNEPYKKGIYTVDPRSYYVDNFGGLKLGRLVLRPAS
jgi:hypothetical protein